MELEGSRLLLVDDDEEALESLSRFMKKVLIPVELNAVTAPQEAINYAHNHHPEVIVLDLCLNEEEGVESGFTLLKNLLAQDPTYRIIALTGHGSAEYGVRALSLGAANFIQKPAHLDHLVALIKDGISHARLKRMAASYAKEQRGGIAGYLKGSSPIMEQVLSQVQYASLSTQSVLLTGETGTGKGLAASAIHAFSARSGKPFVRYQPNFGSSDLTNSELFGHTKGAFTGALQERKGLLQEADGGTLFLDEIDELPHNMQVALLGVLQEKKFRPVGSSKEIFSNFRLVTATNKNPQDSLEKGKLRLDFYHRIAHLTIHLPPLRERIRDLPALAQYFMQRTSERERLRVLGFDDKALEALLRYAWPGNIRELEVFVERATHHAHFCGRSFIAEEDLFLQFSSTDKPSSSALSFSEQVEEFKRKLIEEALVRHNGNQVKAAQELKLDRSSLRRILSR